MKIALVCPSNLLYMPYVKNYKELFEKIDVNYEMIYWDRLHIEPKEDPLIYRDSKKGHSRNFVEYYKYKKFIAKKLKSGNYDKVIVFGIQLAFFLKRVLKNYSGKYIIDIRDYNKILKFISLKKQIYNAKHVVISSEGFKEWLPKSTRYVINHNTRNDQIEEIEYLNNKTEKNSISYVGTLRDLDINIEFIEALKNNNRYKLNYHGEGIISNKLKSYVAENQIKNVYLSGLYKPEEEPTLYTSSQIINILIPNTDINSKTLLPNRLYNAVFYGKPVLTVQGTYVAELIKKYQLGIVLNSFESIDNEVQKYFDEFEPDSYNMNRKLFLENVINDNYKFENVIKTFIHEAL